MFYTYLLLSETTVVNPTYHSVRTGLHENNVCFGGVFRFFVRVTENRCGKLQNFPNAQCVRFELAGKVANKPRVWTVTPKKPE